MEDYEVSHFLTNSNNKMKLAKLVDFIRFYFPHCDLYVTKNRVNGKNLLRIGSINSNNPRVGLSISEHDGELFICYGSDTRKKTSPFYQEVSQCNFINHESKRTTLSQCDDESKLRQLGISFDRYKSNPSSIFTRRMAGEGIGYIDHGVVNSSKVKTYSILESILNEKGNLQDPLVEKLKKISKGTFKVVSETKINEDNVRFDIAIKNNKKILVVCELKFLKPNDRSVNRFKIRCSIGQILEYGYKVTDAIENIEHWLIFNQLDNESLSSLQQIIIKYSLPITVWTFSNNILEKALGNSNVLPSLKY